VYSGLSPGLYTVSVDSHLGWDTIIPENGFFRVELREGKLVDPLEFVLSNMSGTSTATEDGSDALPNEFALLANHPNPFNPTTQISYQLSEGSQVQIVIYDMLGRAVETLVDAAQPAGTFTVSFDASDLPSGMYLYRMTAGSFVNSRKMILLK
jgi:type IX secretion system substrate protein